MSLISLAACLWMPIFGAIAQAAIVFSPDGDDLVITINDPIEITSLVSHSSSIMGVAFINVYTSPQAGNFPGNYGDAVLITPGGSSSAGRGAGILGNYGFTSIYVLFGELTSFSFSMAPGDTIVLGPGVRTLPGFLANSPLPDTKESEIAVYLISQYSHPIPPALGATTVGLQIVPEPNSYLLVASATGFFLMQRSRRTSRKAEHVSSEGQNLFNSIPTAGSTAPPVRRSVLPPPPLPHHRGERHEAHGQTHKQ